MSDLLRQNMANRASDMMLVQFNLIATVTMLFKLSKVVDTKRCSCVAFDLGENEMKLHMEHA